MMNTIHVTNHFKGTKMAGIQSISTSCLYNPICQERAKCADSVCAHCYAQRLCKFRTTLQRNLEENSAVLSSRLLKPSEAAAVNISTVIGRIESFGDVANVIQARNYIRIIRAHKSTRFGIWSKNWGIWHAAFKLEGKPKNCTFVLSSMHLNQPAEVHDMMRKYVDHVFTVWTKDRYAEFEGGPTECAGLSCMKCQKCYHKGGSFEINEKLR